MVINHFCQTRPPTTLIFFAKKKKNEVGERTPHPPPNPWEMNKPENQDEDAP